MKYLIAVMVGGALGAAARYLMMLSVGSWFENGFLLGTILVNVVGALLLGGLIEITNQLWSPSPMIRMFLITGILGSFTTFSAITLDFYTLLGHGEILVATLYVFVTCISGITAFFGGLFLLRALL
ncbi:MAG: fluoride efflux transporter CrcB [Magnetovibrio sp.]|nr:fluoride efflux transporter CrcB [Magnetovibrio sp.]